MFVLTEKHLFWWPVTVAMPDPSPDGAGEILEQTFECRFEALPIEDAKRFDAQRLEAGAADSEAELLDRVVQDWRGIVGPDKSAVAFSREALKRAARWSWFRTGVYAAYLSALRGQAAQRKN